MKFGRLTDKVIRAAIEVHRGLGPGLFEEVYKACLKHELQKVGLQVTSEVNLPVVYDGIELELGYRIDLLVENQLIVELKSVTKLLPVHNAQLLTYIRLANIDTGLLLNFNTPVLKDGIKRVVNTKHSASPRLRVT